MVGPLLADRPVRQPVHQPEDVSPVPGGVDRSVQARGCDASAVAASPEEFRRFADRSRVPLGLRSGYVRFAMRTVIDVAPTAEDLASSFTDVAVRHLSVKRFPDMPFLIAVAVAD